MYRNTGVTNLILKNLRAYVYLSTIINLYNRHIVFYVISKRNNLKIVINILNGAVLKHKLIIHSNQYTSYE